MRTGELPDTTATVAAATLTGDIRDFMLGQAKRNPKPWDQRTNPLSRPATPLRKMWRAKP